MSSSSSIVIKVKFKETLRRFIASIDDEDEKLVINVAMLREKIRGFFSFDSGVEFTLTYVDEDGDNVTLVDDDDLLDIVKQSLDPLRITVELIKSDHGESSQTSSRLNETLNRIFKFPGKNPEVGSLNSKKEEIHVKKATEGVKFKDVSQPQNGFDLHVPYFHPHQARMSASTGVVEGSTGKNKEAIDGIAQKVDTGSEKKKESQQINQMGTKTAFTFPKPDSGMFKATNQSAYAMPPKNSVISPNYEDYLKINNPSSVSYVVRCNLCGVTSLTADRNENYNLCRSCIYGKGKQSYSPFSRPYDPLLHIPPPPLPKSDVFGCKLNSGFLLDVNVPDGTIMSPSTKFTKVWRMWNNGPIVWPQGTHLQWVSGDRLGSSDSVNVQIPLFGVPVNKEIDIIVNFIAPELPGSYVSYWRMASPSGQKFGQQVWVMIKVDDPVKESGETSISQNLPPVVKNLDEVVNQDSENNLSKETDSDATSVDSKDNDQEIKLPIYDSVIDDEDDDEDEDQDEDEDDEEDDNEDDEEVEDEDEDEDDDEDDDEDEDDDDDEDEVLTHSPATMASMSSLFDTTKVETALSSIPEALDTTKVKSPLTEVVTQDSGVTMDSFVMPATLVSCAPSSSSSSSSTVPIVQPSSSSSQGISSDEEQLLLEDLEHMGFDQVDLNKEILRRNNYDMEKSIDDLCGVSEWDPILVELEEMGFEDEEANRELLKKNNGSITRVVLDLINGKRG